jgi:hypothetical protein
MIEIDGRPDEEITEAAQKPESRATDDDTPMGYGLTLLDADAQKFVSDLDDLGCAIWIDHPRGDGKGEFFRPQGWQKVDARWNSARFGGFTPGSCVCVNTGDPLVVVDVDPRNGGDVDAVRRLLTELEVRIFAEVISPSLGRHFYVAGGYTHLPTVHGKLPGLPGVDLQSHGANVFVPGTQRPKYDGKGYEIVSNDLQALRTDGDADGAAALATWVADHLPAKGSAGQPSEPWNGTPPDPRQQRYLSKVLDENAKAVAQSPQGQRNDALYQAALKCSSFVTGAGLDQRHVEERLTEAAIECGLADDDGLDAVESTIASAFTIGLQNPRAVPDLAEDVARGRPEAEDVPDVAAEDQAPSPSAPDPQAEGTDGAVLLEELQTTLKTYVVFPDHHTAVAAALWIAATHGIACWNAAPRLVLNSPQKRCGKTRALDVISGMCHNALVTVNASSAAVYRSLGGDRPPTLVIDEADAIFGSKRSADQNEDLRALLNAGYQRNRPAIRCVGTALEPTEFPTFAMVALAGIGAMPDTITDRAINITMRRRITGEKVSGFRARRDEPVLHRLRARLAAWVQSQAEELTNAVPDMPVEDRAADTWEPLIAIADAAGASWPDRARQACIVLVKGADDADEDRSPGIKLLTDIKQVFMERDVPFLASADLVGALRAIEDSPWDQFDLTASKLAFRLREFGVKPRHNTEKTARGYSVESFYDAFQRYTRPEPSGTTSDLG